MIAGLTKSVAQKIDAFNIVALATSWRLQHRGACNIVALATSWRLQHCPSQKALFEHKKISSQAGIEPAIFGLKVQRINQAMLLGS
jgi:hypothetical protein